MTTRLDLRTAIRLRLEDTGATPLWDDATLNELLEGAMQRYGARFPEERAVTVAVDAGDTVIAVTPELAAEQVVRVFDPAGEAVPRSISLTSAGYHASGQGWRWWNGELLLARGAIAGDWRIEYRGGREAPANDVDPVDLISGDEEIVVLMATAAALRRRAIEDGKRGLTRGIGGIEISANRLEEQAEARMSARRKRVHAGFLG